MAGPGRTRLSPAKREVLARRLAAHAVPTGSPLQARGVDEAPLTSAQHRLWVTQQLMPSSAAYNCLRGFRVRGPLDLAALTQAADGVVARHAVLRSTFSLAPHGAAAHAHPGRRAQVDIRDAGDDQESHTLLREAAATPFDLEHDVLLRVHVVRLAPDRHDVLVVTHHAASDEASRSVLVSELEALYAAAVDGRPDPLAPLPLQYGDYAAWLDANPTHHAGADAVQWWVEHLQGSPPFLALATDRPRSPSPSSAGARWVSCFDAIVGQGVRDLARAEGTTPFAVLLAGLGALLARVSRQPEVVIGTPVTGRDREELEGLIGLFSNTMALRVDTAGEVTLRGLVAQTRATVAAALSRAQVPFDAVVAALSPERDLSRHPLFQVVLNVESARPRPMELTGTNSEILEVDPGQTKFDLAVVVSDDGAGLRVLWEYSTALFDEATVARLHGHLAVLLSGGLAAPDAPLASFSLLTDAEVAEQEAANTTARPVPEATVLDLVELRARDRRDATAVHGPSDMLSWDGLVGGALRVGRHLRDHGVMPGDLVGVCVERSAGMLAALLGVHAAGAAYVPLDPDYPAARLAIMLEDALCPVVLTTTGTHDRLPSGRHQRLDLATLLASAPVTVELPDRDVDAVAYCIFTSGSTGRPKGVEVTHRNLVNLLLSMAEEPGLGPEDVLVAVTTLSFDIAALELFGPLIVGGTLVVAPSGQAAEPDGLLRLVETYRGTVVQATPSSWRLLVEAGWTGVPMVRAWCGGEALAPELAEALTRHGVEVWNLYGPTETTIWSTVSRVVGPRVSIGHPIANTDCWVVEPGGTPAPAGVAGELVIGGTGVARGYHGRPDLTAERFVRHPVMLGERAYRTGDLARRLTDGTLECLGRLDHQVKVSGFRIELGDIEAALTAGTDAAEAVAVVRLDGAEPCLVGYVRPAAGARIDLGRLREHLTTTLPTYMVPAALVVLDELPRMPNGKTDRGALPAPDATAFPRLASRLPATALERLVADVFAEVLAVDSVGAETSFFALGGGSLAAMRAAVHLTQRLGRRVALVDLFESPTPAALAAILDEEDVSETMPLPLLDRGADGVPADAPLSAAQQRVWFLERVAPGSGAYNVTVLYDVVGTLDHERLAGAVRSVAARHEVLRTTFHDVGGVPIQRVHPWLPVEVTDYEVAAGQGADRLRAEAARPFDFETDALLRVSSWQTAEGTQLLLVLHHLAVDGYALDLLVADLAAAYRGEVLPVGGVQAADVAQWQARQVFDGELAWWRHKLAGAPDLLELPTDYPRREELTVAGGRRQAVLPPVLTGAVRELAAQEGSTVFQVLAASLACTLCRWSGQEEVVIGTATAGRDDAALEQVVAYLANTVALRVAPRAGEPFTALLARVRTTTQEAIRHSALPFDRLVGELAPRRDLSFNPLFQVLFVAQPPHDQAVHLGDATLTPAPLDRGTARFDLSISVTERAEELAVVVEHSGLYHPATVDQLVRSWTTLLGAAVGDPALPVGSLSLLPDSELAQGVAAPVAAADPRTVLAGFAAAAAARPDAPAVRYGNDRLTYGELAERGGRLACRLREGGVRPGDVVGVCLPRSTDLMVGLVGILWAGAAYLPLEPTYPVARLTGVVEDAGATAVVSHSDVVAELQGLAATILLDQPMPAASIEPFAAGPGDLAYVIYTSGSTGRPKGVEICHGGLAHLLHAMAQQPGLRAGEVMVGVTTPAFDLSVPDLWLPLATGAELVLVPNDVASDGARLAMLLDDVGADVMQATPSTWRLLLETGWRGRPTLRIVVGGEGYPAELASRLRPLVSEVWNFYGPTEATVWTTCAKLEGPWCDPLPLGSPLPGWSVLVTDDAGRPVPDGVAGELVIGGVGLARGYLGRPDLSAERFVSIPLLGGRGYRTGDLVRRGATGELVYLGRMDHQVKLRGHRIELGEVEAILAGAEGVDVAVVVVRPDPAGDDALVAYVVPDAEVVLEPARLRAQVAAVLPHYMVPAFVVVLDGLPLSPNGKIDRKALPAPSGDSSGAGTEYVAPRTPVEEVLVELWTDVLGAHRIGVYDDFFALGGHSLKITQVASRLRDAFALEVPLRVLYEGPTVSQMAAAVSAELLGDAELEALLADLDDA